MAMIPTGPAAGGVDDARRLSAVARLDLTGHAGDPLLDGLVQTLATACDVPVAVINLVTPDLQTYPAEVGVGATCTRVPDGLSFCSEVVRTGAPVEVADAAAHPVYGDNPLVQAGEIGAYAGEPLLHAGEVVGAVAVFDARARSFTAGQLSVLRAQALLAGAVLCLRATSAWDPLTSLATRPVLLDRTTRALARAERTGALVALLVLDVAGMATVNAAHGSDVGDEVLRRLAGRLHDACGPADSAARTSGDEFAVLLEDLASQEEARARAAALLSAVRGPVDVDGTVLDVRLRSGLATGPAASADVLLAAAERSLTALGVVVTAEPLPLDAARLRRAVADGELVLHYQPVVPLTGRRVEAVEALVRWQHPAHGLLPPAAFLPLAEASGIVIELGTWVLQAAAAQAATWERAGRDLTVSLNLSPGQLADRSLVDTVRRVLLEAGARPDRLRLELTESALMDSPQAEALQALGVHVAQGFLWCPALPAAELEAWLDRWAPPEPGLAALACRPSRPRPGRGSAEERIVRMHAQGASLHTIAAAVNAAGHRTEAGARWHVRSVARAVASYASAEPAGTATPVR